MRVAAVLGLGILLMQQDVLSTRKARMQARGLSRGARWGMLARNRGLVTEPDSHGMEELLLATAL